MTRGRSDSTNKGAGRITESDHAPAVSPVGDPVSGDVMSLQEVRAALQCILAQIDNREASIAAAAGAFEQGILLVRQYERVLATRAQKVFLLANVGLFAHPTLLPYDWEPAKHR